MSSNFSDPPAAVAVTQLALMLWSADDAIVNKRLDGTITAWNPAAEQLFGYAAEDIVGQSIRLLLPPDRQEEEDRVVAQLVHGERIRHFETVRRRKDGTLVDVSVSIAPILNHVGQVVGATKIARDISTLVAARKQTVRVTQFLRAHVSASRAIAKSSTDIELFAEICRICVELGGVRLACVVEPGSDQLRLQSCAGLQPDEAQYLAETEALRAVVGPALAGGEAVASLSAGLPPAVPVEPGPALQASEALAAVPFRRGGRISGALVLVAGHVDFFDTAIMELLADLMTDMSFALTNRATTAEFEGIVQSASDAIIAVDTDRRILRMNPAAAEMFRWREAEALGQPIDRLIPERFRAGHAELMDRFGTGAGLPRRMGAARALSGLRADGTEFPIEATVSRFGSGRDLRLIVALRDVSSLREAEEAQVARNQAEVANQSKTEFLSFMSHELRTPLNAILGFAQVMLNEHTPQPSKRQREQLGHIRAAGKHLHVLISDLLDMGRIEAGKLVVQCKPLSMEDVLEDVFLVLDTMAQSAGLQFEKPRDLAGLPLVLADATRLRQVLLNLLSNAIKYNRPKGSVNVFASVSDDAVILHVEDSGIGMSAEQVEQLFVPYNRLGRESSGIEGVGIGLVVTKLLVDLMNMKLQIESEPGKGTRAKLIVPRADPGAIQQRHTDSQHAALEAGEIEGVVLSVEDNEVNQLLVEAALGRSPKVELLQAGDGASGLRLARARQPDLILLDLTLPDMDGYQFMREMADDIQIAAIPIMVLSALSEPEDVARALKHGAVEYLTKPIDLRLFIEKLSAILSQNPSPPHD
jgi:PAS domain S-box-containing protein